MPAGQGLIINTMKKLILGFMSCSFLLHSGGESESNGSGSQAEAEVLEEELEPEEDELEELDELNEEKEED